MYRRPSYLSPIEGLFDPGRPTFPCFPSSFVFTKRENERLKGNEKKAGVGTHTGIPAYLWNHATPWRFF